MFGQNNDTNVIMPIIFTNSKFHEDNMGPTWGQQDPGGPHVGPVNIATRVVYSVQKHVGV